MDSRERAIEAGQLAARAAATMSNPPWSTAPAGLDSFLGFLREGAEEAARRQINAFREDLRAEIARDLERRGDPRNFLDAQSLGQLILRAVRAVVLENDAEKRRTYARVVCRANSAKWAGRLRRADQVLRSLVDVSDDDFQVLQAVIRCFAAEDALDAAIVAAHLPGFEVERLRAHFDRLQRLGLIANQTGNSAPFWSSESGGRFVSTPLLADVAELLQDGS